MVGGEHDRGERDHRVQRARGSATGSSSRAAPPTRSRAPTRSAATASPRTGWRSPCTGCPHRTTRDRTPWRCRRSRGAGTCGAAPAAAARCTDMPDDRDHDHHVAEAAVHRRVAHVEPHERGRGHHDVRDQVVHVEEADERGVVQHEVLQARLAEHAERALEADDVACVAQRGVDVALAEEAAVLVERAAGRRRARARGGASPRSGSATSAPPWHVSTPSTPPSDRRLFVATGGGPAAAPAPGARRR